MAEKPEQAENDSWTVVKNVKKEKKEKRKTTPRNPAPRGKVRDGEQRRNRTRTRDRRNRRDRGDPRSGGGTRTQSSGSRRNPKDRPAQQPIGTMMNPAARNVAVRSNALQKAMPSSQNQWAKPPVVHQTPPMIPVQAPPINPVERPVSQPPSRPPSVTPEPAVLQNESQNNKSGGHQHELNVTADRSVVIDQNSTIQPKPIGPPSKATTANAAIPTNSMDNIMNPPSDSPQNNNNNNPLSSSALLSPSETTTIHSNNNNNKNKNIPSTDNNNNKNKNNSNNNLLHSSSTPYKLNNESSNNTVVGNNKTEIYSDPHNSSSQPQVISAPLASNKFYTKAFSLSDNRTPSSPTTFTWIGSAPKEPPKIELLDEPQQIASPVENEDVVVENESTTIVQTSGVEDEHNVEAPNKTTSSEEENKEIPVVISDNNDNVQQTTIDGVVNAEELKQLENENPEGGMVNNNGGQNWPYQTINPYIDQITGQPITFDENQAWGRAQNYYHQQPYMMNMPHMQAHQFRQHFPMMHYPIQGTTPGMVQNPLAPGLPTTKMYSNNPQQQQPHPQNPYQHANSQLFIPTYQQMPFMHQQQQQNRNPQNEKKTQSKNLTHFNPPPIIDAYETPQYFIQPTHIPTKQKGHHLLLNQLANPLPRIKNFEDLFSCPDVFHHYSPVSIIAQFLTFNELMNKFLVLNKRIHECGKFLPLLENLTVRSLHMFNLNGHIPAWNKFRLLESETSSRFFSKWSPKGLKHVKICEKETNFEEEGFVNLIDWLEKADEIELMTIEGDSGDQTLLHEQENNNLKKLLSRVDCKHLLIENLSFELNPSILNALKKNNLKELTVTSEKIEWDLNMINELPTSLEGLTICRPNYSLLSVCDKLPSYLKRIYIQNVRDYEKLENVEVSALFKKVEHVQLDFSSLHLFPTPLEDVTTQVRRLDLFYDYQEKGSSYEQIFQNLPFSLRHLTLTYTSHARNKLEGWWSFIPVYCRQSLEIIELHNSDENGLNDLVTMFRSVKFTNLQKFVFTSSCSTLNVREKLQDIVPVNTELVVQLCAGLPETSI